MTSPRSFDDQVGPTRIRFGLGRIRELPDAIAEFDSHRPFVICTKRGFMQKEAALETVPHYTPTPFNKTPIHCPEAIANERLVEFNNQRADCLIVIGGGSLIGLGKFITRHTGVPLIVIPTTYSGSEMTAIYGVKTDSEKRVWKNEAARAQSVIYDPELTYALPAHLTATIGMNSLAHLVEALYPARPNAEAQKLAIDGLRAQRDGLPASIKRPNDPIARCHALYGGYLGGRVVSMAGIALHHKLCHVLGGHYGAPHGETNSVILPHVIAYNAPAIPEAIQTLQDIFKTDDAAKAVYDFAAAIGAPLSLKSLGLSKDGLDYVADETARTIPYNPRPADKHGILELLEAAYEGHCPSS